jgi:flavodoxin I
MKTLIIYDSAYGNTEKIAQAVAESIRSQVTLVRIGEKDMELLKGVELLIVGSPTQKFQPTEAIKAYLNNLQKRTLNGVMVAAFDTRLDMDTVKNSTFRWMLNTGGFAARKIARKLVKKGGRLIAQPEGFIVLEMEGPLKDGELERAGEWGKKILALVST